MAEPDNTTKQCTKCHRILPVTHFTKHAQKKSGLNPQCKDCTRAKCRDYYKANSEALIAYQRGYYEENKEYVTARARRFQQTHREKIAAADRRYREANKERLKERRAAYFQENKTLITKRNREYRRANPELNRVYTRRYRERHPERQRAAAKQCKAMRASAPGRCTPAQWLAKCDYWGWRCYLCDTPVTSKTLHMEHRKPIARGGSHWPANLAPACPRCNLTKNKKTEIEFRAELQDAGSST